MDSGAGRPRHLLGRRPEREPLLLLLPLLPPRRLPPHGGPRRARRHGTRALGTRGRACLAQRQRGRHRHPSLHQRALKLPCLRLRRAPLALCRLRRAQCTCPLRRRPLEASAKLPLLIDPPLLLRHQRGSLRGRLRGAPLCVLRRRMEPPASRGRGGTGVCVWMSSVRHGPVAVPAQGGGTQHTPAPPTPRPAPPARPAAPEAARQPGLQAPGSAPPAAAPRSCSRPARAQSGPQSAASLPSSRVGTRPAPHEPPAAGRAGRVRRALPSPPAPPQQPTRPAPAPAPPPPPSLRSHGPARAEQRVSVTRGKGPPPPSVRTRSSAPHTSPMSRRSCVSSSSARRSAAVTSSRWRCTAATSFSADARDACGPGGVGRWVTPQASAPNPVSPSGPHR